MREQVIQVVKQYIDAVRRNDASALPLHPDAVCEFPTSTYRGAASFRKGLDDFARIMKSIEVVRLIVDGDHCVALVNIDTVFGVIPFAEHIHVANGQIASIRGYCDPRPMLAGQQPAAPPPPHARIMQMATGHFLSRVVYAAAKFGVADHLADGPRSAADLAGATGCDPQAFHRFLRTLTNFDIIAMTEDGRFMLTPLGEAMKSDAPGFVRSAVLTMGGPVGWTAWEHIEYSLRTGLPAADHAFGKPLFDLFAEDPEAAERFSETMIAVHGAEPPAVAAGYDFSTAHTVVDVGGASGNMLAHILNRHAGPRGVLFDLPQATAGAPALLKARGVDDRVTIEHGSFFDRVPAGGDIYLLSHVIHDWNEERCLTIFGNLRQAMTPASRLLLIELVLRDGATPGFGTADMTMMLLAGGAERTAREYESLLARAGLRMTRVLPTTTSASIVEAVLA